MTIPKDIYKSLASSGEITPQERIKILNLLLTLDDLSELVTKQSAPKVMHKGKEYRVRLDSMTTFLAYEDGKPVLLLVEDCEADWIDNFKFPRKNKQQ